MENSRRDFLKKSLIGLSGAAIMTKGIAPGSAKADVSVPELPARTLGKTGIKTPLISMGTAGASSIGLIREAHASGIKLFFSATYYGEGNNERLAGEALKGLARDSFFVGTAVPPDGMDNRTGTFIKPFDSRAYISKAEESLKRFGLDYIDICLLPYAGKKEMVLNEEVLKAMEQIRKKGMARFMGIASHSDQAEALNAAAGSGIYDVAMIAYNNRIADIGSLNDAIGKAVKAGMGIVAMKTTAGGARNKAVTPASITASLKWVLANENISSIVSGMTSLEEMKSNLAMIKDIRLTEKEKQDLGIALNYNEPGLYCRQCRKCIPECVNNLDIPTIMRSYMYAYGYRNMDQAWHTLAEADSPRNACTACGTCSVSCSAGFDIKEKITDISRLRDVPPEFLKS